jgi:hypothetical protein
MKAVKELNILLSNEQRVLTDKERAYQYLIDTDKKGFLSASDTALKETLKMDIDNQGEKIGYLKDVLDSYKDIKTII